MECHNSLRMATQLWEVLLHSKHPMDSHNTVLRAATRHQLLAILLLHSLVCHKEASKA